MRNMIIATIFLFALESCSDKPAETKEEISNSSETSDRVELTRMQIEKNQITSAIPDTGNMPAELKVNGIVEVPPRNLISISFPLGGYLESTDLLPGKRVSRGQIIGWMEDPSFIQLQQDYLVARQKLSYLEKNYNRQLSLNATKANSDQLLEQAEDEYKSQRILKKGLEEKLRLVGLNPEILSENNISRKIALRAPINGFVSKVNVNVGKYVNPTDVLFELVDPNDIHAVLTVFEKDILKVKVGQKVKISLNDQPEKIYNASVLLVSRNLDENRSVSVHCHLTEKNHNLLPGMFLNASIETTDNFGLILPSDAVVRFGNAEYIFTDNGDGSFDLIQLETSQPHREQTLVVPIKNIAGKKVVTHNAYALLSKLKNTGEE